jgi:hypothetical protein
MIQFFLFGKAEKSHTYKKELTEKLGGIGFGQRKREHIAVEGCHDRGSIATTSISGGLQETASHMLTTISQLKYRLRYAGHNTHGCVPKSAALLLNIKQSCVAGTVC